MDIKIHSVINHGNAKQEIVWLEVIRNCDIGKFLMVDSTYTKDGKVSNKVRHPYWFPDQQVKAGDFVALHTCSGTNHIVKEASRQIHHFYWDLVSAVWNDDGDNAILFHTDEWIHKKAKA